jgi:hypothetical protein
MVQGQVLKTDVDFDNAMLFGLNISVWQQGEIVDYGGKIIANTDDSVHINDGKYLKAVCAFKVR